MQVTAPKIEIISRTDAAGAERFAVKVTRPAWDRRLFSAKPRMTPHDDDVQYAYVDDVGMVRLGYEAWLTRHDIPYNVFWGSRQEAETLMCSVQAIDICPRAANQAYQQF